MAFRLPAFSVLAAVCTLSAALAPLAAEPLKVLVIGGENGSAGRIQAYLEAEGRMKCLSAADESWAAAIVLPGPSAPGAKELADWQRQVAAGRGLVVLKADRLRETGQGFVGDVLGAKSSGLFARGAPMHLINLYPHPILTDAVRGFATDDAMIRWELAGDDQVIMEGTLGEETVPMAWVRKYHRGRVVALEPGRARDLQDRAYLQILANSLWWAAGSDVPGAVARVQRAYLAGAYPSALAITFPRGPSVCYDPVRGGIDYVWDGDFLDPRPAWETRHGSAQREFAAATFGPSFYREAMVPSLHAGSRDGAANYRFLGYRQQADGSPELHYAVGTRAVTELITAAPDGTGIVRHFHVAAGNEPIWLKLDPQASATVGVEGAVLDEGGSVRWDAPQGGDFTVTIGRKAAVAAR